MAELWTAGRAGGNPGGLGFQVAYEKAAENYLCLPMLMLPHTFEPRLVDSILRTFEHNGAGSILRLAFESSQR